MDEIKSKFIGRKGEFMQLIVDRIEGEFLIVENELGKIIQVPKDLIPNAKENDIINIEIDHKRTENRKKEIKDLMNQIFEG